MVAGQLLGVGMSSFGSDQRTKVSQELELEVEVEVEVSQATTDEKQLFEGGALRSSGDGKAGKDCLG